MGVNNLPPTYSQPARPYQCLAQDIGSLSESTITEASSTVADMVDSVDEGGMTLDDAAAVSLVSVSAPKGFQTLVCKWYSFRCWLVGRDIRTNHDSHVPPYWQVLSELFDGPSASHTASSSASADTALIGKESRLHLLADVCNTLAYAAESGEELGEIRTGSLAIQVCSFFHSCGLDWHQLADHEAS